MYVIHLGLLSKVRTSRVLKLPLGPCEPRRFLRGELLGVSKVLIMSFDRFLVAAESRELSQADKYYMCVFLPQAE